MNVTPATLFQDLRSAIEAGVSDAVARAELTRRVTELEKAKGKPRFLEKYTQFISAAAAHMKLVSPFIPALTELIDKRPPG